MDGQSASGVAKVLRRPASLADVAYRQIEEMIVNRILPPESMISEQQLCKDLQCGRTPVREALQRLALHGYVEIHPSRGTMVSSVGITKQLELLEVRRPLEDLVVRLACTHATEAERDEMRQLAIEIGAAAECNDQMRFLTANKLIQECTVKASHNSVLVVTATALHGMSRLVWLPYLEETDGFKHSAGLHERILAAIVGRDEISAAAAMKHFLDYLENLSRQAVERRFGPAGAQ